MLLSHGSSIFKLCIFATSVALCLFYWRLQSNNSFYTIIDDVSSVISTHFPFTATSPSATTIPRKLWYKLGPSGLNSEVQAWTNSCITQNTTYAVNFLTDESGDAYVKEHFESWPSFVDMYLGLSIPILKADILRYVLLYHEGGIWNDLDVSCEDTPIDEWVPEKFQKDAALVVGLEFDVGWGDSFTRQFESWTMMAKPKSPHLLVVLQDILEGIHQKTSENNVLISELAFDMIGDVVDLTGPRRFTKSIYKSLSTTLNETIDERNVTMVMEPKLIGDVLVMPGYSFAAGSNRYGENFTVGAPLVTHHYAGTWKNDHGGE